MDDASIREAMTESERAQFERGAQMLADLQRGRTFDDWVIAGEGLIALKAAAIRVLHIKKARGRYYSDAMHKACKESPYAHMPSSTRANLIYCVENLATIHKMCAQWELTEVAKVTHPDNMRARLRVYLKDGGESDDEPKTSPMQRMTEERNALREENQQLKDVVRSGGDISAMDTAADIARHIATTLIATGLSERKILDVLKRASAHVKDHFSKDWNKAAKGEESKPLGKDTA